MLLDELLLVLEELELLELLELELLLLLLLLFAPPLLLLLFCRFTTIAVNDNVSDISLSCYHTHFL